MPDDRQQQSPKQQSGSPGLDQSFMVSPPSINLPKGGGAIKGIGEKFAANPVTGTGSMSVPIATSPGRSGFGPQLSLSYDSGAGNGPFGLGWNLSLPSITRKTDKGIPRYLDAEKPDVFILSGAEDLVPEFEKDAAGDWMLQDGKPVVYDKLRTVNGKMYRVHRYRPRIEGLFARIERWSSQSNSEEVFWRSISKDNITTWYGKSPESRIFDPDDPSRIFRWLICESHDDKGNVTSYGYKEEDSDAVNLSEAHERNRIQKSRSANRYLKRIRYGNHAPYIPEIKTDKPWPSPPNDIQDGSNNWLFEVVFDYGEHDNNVPLSATAGEWPCRNDPFSSYRAGFEVRTYRLCQRVLMFHHFPGETGVGKDCIVRSTDFDYSYEKNPASAKNPIYSKILSVSQSGYKRDGSGGYHKKSLPPLEFEYSKAEVSEALHEVDPESLENLPEGLDGARYQWVDLDGEGLSGILTEQAGSWFYKRNVSALPVKWDDGAFSVKAKFEPLTQPSTIPSMALSSGNHQFLDLAGDGKLDVAMLDGPLPGFYERKDEGWENFRTFESLPNIDWKDPNLKFVDLNGDGHADVLITGNEVFSWYPSLAEDGFSSAEKSYQLVDEEDGPRLVFADGTQSVYLADLSGDGLTDLARISSNGEVCYWPNLGYGRFGAKVSMDNPPWFDSPDQFDQKRIRLADIDGSGTTDILYLHSSGVHLYFNQSGNRWSDSQPLKAFPKVDNLSSVMAVDLLGNGTACLVWSSPLPGNTNSPMRYIQLMKEKPHLLISSMNNLGAKTEVHYAPSTKFYLQDKRDGKPWITKVPFPVHVVERVETYDYISKNRFTTRYAYHHGYFDGHEREFRGFGMVEQWDSEEYEELSNGNQPTENIDPVSYVPPVHTKTWFHTGIYLGRNHVSDYFAGLLDASDKGEYFREPGLTDAQARELLLDDTVLPDGLTLEEDREACRALKGSMLRQEVYALDGTDKELYPFTVTEQNFSTRRIQGRGDNRHGVFFAHLREALSYHYERNPDDPRVSHAMTLEVDDFGNVLKSLAIGYGRRPGKSPLQGTDKEKQEQTLITYTENRVTNAINDSIKNADGSVKYPDAYRTPLPAESRTHEVTGYDLPAGEVRFGFDRFTEHDFKALTTDLTEIGYEQPTDHTKKQRRRIEHLRTLYREDNLSGLLALGEIKSMALPGENYKLAFTPELLTDVYGGKVTNVMLEDEGKFIHSEGDTNWWLPSGHIFYSSGSGDDAATELTEAKGNFFLPRRYRDPFGTDSFVDYDGYDLLVQETRDILGNRVTAGTRKKADNSLEKSSVDYRVIQPKLMMDSNRNRTQVVFDTLGLVVGTAVMGKPEDNPKKGDLIDGTFVADLSGPDIDAFYNAADPHALAHNHLKKATTRIIYNIDNFKDNGLPPFAVTLARETHFHDPGGNQADIQISFSYSDGFGREIQKKIQAENGKAPKRDAEGQIIAGADGRPEMTANDVDPRWVGSGWTIFNNKGKPVRQFEPFFSDTHKPDFDVKIGVSPILFYDPVGRVVATLHPSHIYEKVVFDPWSQTTYDVNDTVTFNPETDHDVKGFVLQSDGSQRLPKDEYLPTWYELRTDAAKALQRWPDSDAQGNPIPENAQRRASEKIAAEKTQAHADTPTVAYFDSLGRPYLTVTHNRVVCTGHQQNGTEERFATRVEMDIEGNQREVKDERKLPNGTLEQRIVMQYEHDMLGSVGYQISMEAGERWMLNDVTGNPIRAWDSRGFVRRMTYDQLRRPDGLYVSENGNERLAEKTIYGEGQGDAKNHHTRIYQVRDGAGVVTSIEYDFKGNLLESQRDLLPYSNTPDWQQNLATNDGSFASYTTFDALNRPVTATSPDGSVYRPTFNTANLLDKVDANLRGKNDQNGGPIWTSFVKNIDYDAKGQRELIEYGCGAGQGQSGVTTVYEYDPATFRLTNMKTTRPAGLNGLAAAIFTDRKVVQNIHYTYDPAGNIVRIEDRALKSVTYNNVQVDPASQYTYDALYRLIKAEGREHISQTAFKHNPANDNYRDYPFTGHQANPNDLQAMRHYKEFYNYDEVGNFKTVKHAFNNTNWTRTHEYNENSLIEADKKSNRLTKAMVGSGQNFTENFSYDEHGNMKHMQHFANQTKNMHWDFEDQLIKIDLAGGGKAHYIYDASGQRVRKVIESQNGKRQKERIYFGGFEIYREFKEINGAEEIELERESLHMMDDKQRIASVETQTIKNGNDVNDPIPLQRYQLGNHLGSASLELAEDGALISYEEYHPYGTTAFQVGAELSRKRYRYTGKERDDESGLYYYGARYYASWLGRWVSPDPIELYDGINMYRYLSSNNPLRHIDSSGAKTKNAPGAGVATIGLPASSPPLALTTRASIKIMAGKNIPLDDSLKDSRPLTVTYDNRKSNSILGVEALVTPTGKQQELRAITRGVQIDLADTGTGKKSDPLKYIASYDGDCGSSCTAGLNKSGYRIRGEGRDGLLTNFQLFKQGDVTATPGDLTLLKEGQGKRLLNKLDENLYQGKPVAVGIDTHPDEGAGGKGKPDGITDHWAYIIARSYDAQGRVFYLLAENASTGLEPGGEYKQLQKLYVDPKTFTLVKPEKVDVDDDYVDQKYTIVNAREVTPLK